jgi:prefoldin alpha subunit
VPENDGKDYLLPVTESLYVNSKLDGSSKVIIDLGTGYYVEKVRLGIGTVATLKLHGFGGLTGFDSTSNPCSALEVDCLTSYAAVHR